MKKGTRKDKGKEGVITLREGEGVGKRGGGVDRRWTRLRGLEDEGRRTEGVMG